MGNKYEEYKDAIEEVNDYLFHTDCCVGYKLDELLTEFIKMKEERDEYLRKYNNLKEKFHRYKLAKNKHEKDTSNNPVNTDYNVDDYYGEI